MNPLPFPTVRLDNGRWADLPELPSPSDVPNAAVYTILMHYLENKLGARVLKVKDFDTSLWGNTATQR